MTDPTDTDHGTHAQHVPSELIPDGLIQITNYNEEDLGTLADDIAADVNAPAAEIRSSLEKLADYNVPIVEAERSVRRKYGEEEL